MEAFVPQTARQGEIGLHVNTIYESARCWVFVLLAHIIVFVWLALQEHMMATGGGVCLSCSTLQLNSIFRYLWHRYKTCFAQKQTSAKKCIYNWWIIAWETSSGLKMFLIILRSWGMEHCLLGSAPPPTCNWTAQSRHSIWVTKN